MSDKPLRLEWIDPSTLTANPNNWRTHPPSQVHGFKAVFSEVGWAGALLYNEATGRLIDGHLRRDALENEGEPVPVLIGSWTEEQEKKILLTLDPLGTMNEIDYDILGSLVEDIGPQEEDVAAILATLDVELPEQEPPPDPGPQTDRAEELQEQWKVERGQVWEIPSKSVPGKAHRVMCGDSTSGEDVERLMGGYNADAVITDPPYGISREGITNDDEGVLRTLFSNSLSVLPIQNGVIVAFQSPRLFLIWLAAVCGVGGNFERMLWMYKAAQMTYPWRGWLLKSEAILIHCLGDGQWNDVSPYAHDCYCLPEVAGELADGQGHHPTVKPLSVVCDLVARTSRENQKVFDPFLGSGTTIVACEQVGRVGYGMEIEPKYCSVVLQRLQDIGLEPELLR
jgi:hypothetical protein